MANAISAAVYVSRVARITIFTILTRHAVHATTTAEAPIRGNSGKSRPAEASATHSTSAELVPRLVTVTIIGKRRANIYWQRVNGFERYRSRWCSSNGTT